MTVQNQTTLTEIKPFSATFTFGGFKQAQGVYDDLLTAIHQTLQSIDPDFDDENLIVENEEYDEDLKQTHYSGIIIFQSDDKEKFLSMLHKWKSTPFFEEYFSIDVNGKTILTEHTEIEDLPSLNAVEYFFLYDDQGYIPF